MGRTGLLGAVAIAAAVLTTAADAPAEGARGVRKLTLDNGLDVLLVEDHRAPIVAIDVTYDVGWRDDPAGRKGLGRVLELLLLDPSTRHVGRDVLGKMFHALHVEPIRATATYTADQTTVASTVPSNELELALWLESDRMAFGVDGFDQRAIDHARDTVEAERRHDAERQPAGAVGAIVLGALYPDDHPYATPAIGLAADVASATRSDLEKQYRAFYGPNAATLAIVGDIDGAATEALVRKYFGPIVRGGEHGRAEKAAVRLDAEKRVTIEANVDTPRLVVAWPTPGYLAEGDAELDVVALLLGSVRGGRLKKRLEEGGIGKLVDVRQRSHALGSEASIEIVLERGQKPAAALAVVDEELDKIRKGAVSAEDLAAAKLGLAERFAASIDGLGERAALLGAQNRKGKPAPDLVDLLVARYRAVTVAGVQRAVSEHLPVGRRVVATVTPSTSAPVGGRLQEAR